MFAVGKRNRSSASHNILKVFYSVEQNERRFHLHDMFGVYNGDSPVLNEENVEKVDHRRLGYRKAASYSVLRLVEMTSDKG